jgi:hypothetical protein
MPEPGIRAGLPLDSVDEQVPVVHEKIFKRPGCEEVELVVC